MELVSSEFSTKKYNDKFSITDIVNNFIKTWNKQNNENSFGNQIMYNNQSQIYNIQFNSTINDCILNTNFTYNIIYDAMFYINASNIIKKIGALNMSETFKRLLLDISEISKLDNNWDSYGASSISYEVVTNSLNILKYLSKFENLEFPSIDLFPMQNNAICIRLEYDDLSNVNIEIYEKFIKVFI